jgi:hypothetical protein
MSREPLAKKNALCIGDRQRVLFGDHALPERGDVTELLFGGEVVETRRGIRQMLCHV